MIGYLGGGALDGAARARAEAVLADLLTASAFVAAFRRETGLTPAAYFRNAS
jgi:AraC-like DNA-binding protein